MGKISSSEERNSNGTCFNHIRIAHMLQALKSMEDFLSHNSDFDFVLVFRIVRTRNSKKKFRNVSSLFSQNCKILTLKLAIVTLLPSFTDKV